MANPISPKPTADEGVEMSEILRPCPFCGESVELDYSELPNRKHWFITCECCGMMYQSSISQRKYVKVDWNNRPIEDALNARIAELELRLDVYNGNMYDVVVDENAKLEAQVVIANKRIAELEAENERFTVHSDIERQDDKSPNHTQIDTVVY